MVELEALPAAYFACGCYGHFKNLCPSIALDQCIGNDSKKRNSRHDKTLSKIIRGRGGCFKVAGNSRVPFPETMTSTVRFIGSQAMLEVYRTE
ncbi:hypothetical protein Goklo_006006 [Gossypium klotzschianum]|uniref:CCHC-type domain-containing protein n=1 Tax=Gossypium klotzschianum TaxID=34286 RepID=A0A7J8VGR7_9ROSI|nr:hypothetical protein [Gossypium klotzschianum]